LRVERRPAENTTPGVATFFRRYITQDGAKVLRTEVVNRWPLRYGNRFGCGWRFESQRLHEAESVAVHPAKLHRRGMSIRERDVCKPTIPVKLHRILRYVFNPQPTAEPAHEALFRGTPKHGPGRCRIGELEVLDPEISEGLLEAHDCPNLPV